MSRESHKIRGIEESKKVTDELQLLFIASKYRLESNDTNILHGLLLKEDIDWDYFFLLARLHKVLPRVWNNISATLPAVIPDGIKQEHKALIRQHTLHCMATVGQLCTVSALFAQQDILHVPYKGPLLAS